MAKRVKFTVHMSEHVAKFSCLRHALLFAVARSEEQPTHTVEVSMATGLVGQYTGGRPTPEFASHHASGMAVS